MSGVSDVIFFLKENIKVIIILFNAAIYFNNYREVQNRSTGKESGRATNSWSKKKSELLQL